MGLTRVAINRPLAFLMLIIAMVLAGGYAYNQLRKDRFPAISFPVVSISVSYPGASPSDVEDQVTKVIEDTVAGVSGVQAISSTSREGAANIGVQFVEGFDTNQGANDIDRRLAAIGSRLPADATSPAVRKADSNAFPIMNLALTGQRSLADIYQVANDVVLPKMQSVPGVADVQLIGGLQREIEVKVDSQRLKAYGLSLQQVQNALVRENINLPGGRLTEGTSTTAVRTMAQYKSIEELRQAIVITGAKPVRLGDIAQITDGFVEQTRLQRYNGQDAVGLSITKQSDANGLQVATDVRSALARINPTLPRGMSIQVTNDSSVFTQRSLDAVTGDLKIAVILTGIVLLLFLHTFRPTVIVLLSIPTSLITTFAVMYFNGFSLNMFSLMALALSIGILVDDSIVVLENIERHLKLGEAPRQAALTGRSEIGLAAITITMVDVVVYLPVSFMPGNIGRLFREFGITMATATLLSLFCSFTLAPMLASRWLKHHDAHGKHHWYDLMFHFGRVWEVGYNKVASAYRHILAVVLPKNFFLSLFTRVGVVALAASLLWISFMMLSTNMVGGEYAPQEDDGQFQINVSLPPGTSLAGTDAMMRILEERLRQMPEVKTYFTSVGAGGGFGGGSNVRNGQIAVELKEKTERERSIFEVLGDVRRWAREFPQAQIRAAVSSPLAGGGGAAINFRVTGEDLNKLQDVANAVQERIAAVPGVVDVNNDAAQRDPEVRAVIDRGRLADLGLNASAVANALRTAVGGTVVTQMKPDGEDAVDIRLQLSDADKASTANLRAMPLISDSGSIIRLDQVARIVQESGPAQISRTDRQRVVTITGNVSGRTIADVARDIRAATASVPLPEGYQTSFRGQVQQWETARDTLLTTLIASVVLIYMLMVALYESFLTPFAIMFSIPVALFGAIVGLYVTGNTFNIFSLIGMIMLLGLVAKNAILLVDFTNTLRARGLARREALLEAGYTRLRPILMTTCTVVFAMLPLAMKLEAGGESRAPMAVVIIGGVISSTLLTLVLVPTMYTLLDDAVIAVRGVLGFRLAFPSRRRKAAAATEAAGAHAATVSRVHSLAETRPIQGGALDDE